MTAFAGWVRALDQHPDWSPRAMLALALLLRLVVWRVMGGPLIRGDGPAYIEWAQRLAIGDLSGFSDYPLHQLYPILIAPAYALHLPADPYLFLLHMALSMGTVVFLYDAARQFTTRRVAIGVVAVAAIYPALLLWSPFVLSETPFFFFLAFFLSSLLHVIARPQGTRRAARVAVFVLAAALLLFARPVSLAILSVTVGAFCYVALRDRIGSLAARRVWLGGMALGLLAASAVFAFDAPLRTTIVRYPTIAQSLWLSTRYSSSSFREWQPIAEANATLAARFAGDMNGLWDYKVGEAVDFVRAHPETYVAMAGRRFFSYWLPGLFSDGWSASHRLLDLLLAGALYIGVAAALYRRRDLTRWTLLAAALALGILTSFSQLDTDGRYRVPAELILLLLAVDGWSALLMSVLARWRRRGERGAPVAA